MKTSQPTTTKPLQYKIILNWFMFVALAFIYACSIGQPKETPSAKVLVASTPGDSLIKTQLGIDVKENVDFIRWQLNLTQVGDSGTFSLNINYGESQPNTLGFKQGGKNVTMHGTVSISKNGSGDSRDVYTLQSLSSKASFSIVKLHNNLFHLLTPENTLMVGNGGWGYSLNRKDPIKNSATPLPAPLKSKVTRPSADTVIFSGRTPCLHLAQEYNLPVPNDCLKLKWKLTLFRDPKTHLPTRYNLKRTLHRASELEGKWQIVKGIFSNPDAIIYQLDPDKPNESMFFLLGDENVLYFLDKKYQFFIGDHNFSYTLDRMKM